MKLFIKSLRTKPVESTQSNYYEPKSDSKGKCNEILHIISNEQLNSKLSKKTFKDLIEFISVIPKSEQTQIGEGYQIQANNP